MTRDLILAARSLAKKPWFLLAIVAILALGIGASTAVFSIADAVLLRPPYRSAGRLVTVQEKLPNVINPIVPVEDYFLLSAHPELFEQLVPYRRDDVIVNNAGVPDQFFAARTSPGLFSLLGVRASLGRTLADSDDAPNAPHAAVISDRLWRRMFDADPRVIGRGLTVDEDVFTIVGVMPPEFEFPQPQDQMWVPLHLHPGMPGIVDVVARLRDGVNAVQAQSGLQSLAQQIERRDPRKNAGLRLEVSTWQELLFPAIKQSAVLILIAVGFVLLIACANVGSLLLSRAVQRQREIAIRASLGAGFWRVARQLFAESLLLAFAGSVAGIALARVLLDWMLRQLAALPIVLPHLQRVALNGRALAFSTAVCVILACLCSFAPLLFASRTDVQSALRGGQMDTGRRSGRLFSLLIASEAAFAFLLLVGSGLLLRSLIRLQSADNGFHADHVLTMRVPLGSRLQPRAAGRYSTLPRQIQFYRDVLDRVSAVPGVRAAAVVNNLPLSEANTVIAYRTPDGNSLAVSTRTVSEQYFAVMGIRLLEGRIFSAHDPDGLVINEYLAHLFFPDRDPIGQTLGPAKQQVIGVVANSWRRSYDEPQAGELYIYSGKYMFGTFLATIVARTSGDPLAMANALRQQVWAVDPNEPVVKVETMDDIIASSIWRPRFSAWIFAALGGLALLLTSAGIYAVVAYSTALRSKEVGIRVALGAARRNIVSVVMSGAILPLAAGLIAGVIASLILSRFVASLLYETSYTDAFTYLAAAGLLLGLGIIASLRPALRAATDDPLLALRIE